MLKTSVVISATVFILLSAPVSAQQNPASARDTTHSAMVTRLADVQWRGNPAGLSSAVLEGDPSVPDKPYSLLLKLHDGHWIPPHWHPNDKHVVVLAGTLLTGMGDHIDSLNAQKVAAGNIATMHATEHHYEGAKGETILLLYGIGPLTTNYITPPR